MEPLSTAMPRFNRVSSLGVLLFAIIFVRILTLDALPLMDPSESRYASIAQTAVITGNWIVPEFDRGDGPIPFMGKPPLFLWLCTLSMDIFGQDEWASRLPSLLSALIILACVYQMAKRFYNSDTAKAGTLVLLTSFGFFALAGSCMFDMMLAAGITVAMTAFYIAINTSGRDARAWGWMLFIGILLGFLIKGPIAVVLTLVPIVVWAFWCRSFSQLKSIPWLGGFSFAIGAGILFFLTLERSVPGFNYYFFVQENFLRFVSGEYGDLFGTSHSVPYGTAWFFLLLTGLPWSLLYFREMWRTLCREIKRPASHNEMQKLALYLLLWAGAAPGLFTITRGVLFTYVLPSLPALAILSAPAFEALFKRRRRLVLLLSAGVPIIGILLPGVYEIGLMPRYSTREVIESLEENEKTGTLYFYPKQPFSALFYTRMSPATMSLEFVHDLALIPPGSLLVTRKNIPPEDQQKHDLQPQRTIERVWFLYRKQG